MNSYKPALISRGFLKFSCFVLFFFGAGILYGQQTVIRITGFKHEKGKALVRITDPAGKVVETFERNVSGKEVKLVVNGLKEGKYAVEVFQDENNNQKLDTATLGYPVEPWGVSNNVRPKFRAPNLEEMLIMVLKDKEILINIK